MLVSPLFFYLLFDKISPMFNEIVKDIWSGFDFSYVLSILLSVIPSLISITIHELSHGYVAFRLGDDTAKRAGRLTANPLKHLDIMGLLMLVVFHVGWAKPVPVNMYKFDDPKRGMAFTAFAGPLSNFVLAVLFCLLCGILYIPLKASSLGFYFIQMLTLGIYINIGLCIFNLIPIPPLDGSKILFSILSDDNYFKLMHYERYFSIIIVLFVASGLIGKPLNNSIDAVFRFISPLAQYASNITYYLFYR